MKPQRVAAINSAAILLLLVVHSTATLAQPAPAPTLAPEYPAASPLESPPPPPPPSPPKITISIIKILEKAAPGDFTVLIKLLRSTHVADQVNSQLADLNDGITFFAPDDVAFSSLKAGTLNSLSDEQQVQLMQYHVVPTYLSVSQFETVSNPLMTKAGGTGHGEFPLNVTTYGDRVSISTGVVRASVAKTLYSDNKLALYQVDKVLLPPSIFPAGGDYAQPPSVPKKEPAAKSVSGASEVGRTRLFDVFVRGVLGVGVAGFVASFCL